MPITFEEALQATDPNLDDTDKGPDGLTARGRSAMAILNGVRANEVYWDHRPELEALKAQATGHGVVQRGGESEEDTPTQVGPGADPAAAPEGESSAAIEGTATEESSATAPTEPATAATTPTPSPDNPNDAIARLRAQVEGLGGTPEA